MKQLKTTQTQENLR